jgi:hypothetical protein
MQDISQMKLLLMAKVKFVGTDIMLKRISLLLWGETWKERREGRWPAAPLKIKSKVISMV